MLLTVFIVFVANIFFLNGQNSFLDGDYDVFIRVDDKVLRIRDSAQIQIKDSSTTENGTVVNSDGSYQRNNEQTLQLSEGECIGDDGLKYRSEYQFRFRIEQEKTALKGSQGQDENQKRYHFVLIKGKVFQIKHYEQNWINNAVDLGYGKILQSNGIHRTSYGRSRLKEGGCININAQPLINIYEHRKVIIRREIKTEKRLVKKSKSMKV